MYYLIRKVVWVPVELWKTEAFQHSAELARDWLKLSLLCLMLAGFFSAVIVFARTPMLADLIGDPQFSQKSLVLHVVLALVGWFYSFLAVLFLSMNSGRVSKWPGFALKASVIGIALICLSILMPNAEPILANYIPVIDNTMFLAGLGLFGGALCLTLIGNGLFQTPVASTEAPLVSSLQAREVIHAAGLMVILAVGTILVSMYITTPGLDRTMFFELTMWGGGHIFQFANSLGMIAVWLILLRLITGKEGLGVTTNRTLLVIMCLPVMFTPLLLVNGTQDQLYYNGFTQMMRWGMFPVISAYILIGAYAIIRARRQGDFEGKFLHNVWFNGFLVSAVLMVAGFIIGAMIRDSSTLIPAHYHACLGAVTVAYMTAMFYLMKRWGYSWSRGFPTTILKLQPLLFGFGNTIFVAGFAWAGLNGMGRKMYGTDQDLFSPEVIVGMGMMSFGGLLAIAGGLMFLYLVIHAYNNKNNR